MRRVNAMRVALRCRAAIALAAVVLAAAAVVAQENAIECPKRCVCISGDELEFRCPVPGASETLAIAARKRDYINIDCEGRDLSCDDFPEISMGGGEVLPSLGIRECNLRSNISCLLRKMDVADVEVVTFTRMSSKVTTDTFLGLNKINTLMLFNSVAETSVPVEEISTLHSLRHFRLCGGNISLTRDQFRGAPKLKYLELSTDRVKSVPAGAFHHLEELETLNFWGNNIENLDKDAFEGLGKLQQTSLNTNKMRSIPSRLFAHTPLLKTISIERNFIDVLPSELFQGLNNLEEIKISNDVELKLNGQVFANLPTLKTLKLERSSITRFPPNLFSNSSELISLLLAQNKLVEIPKAIFRDLIRLETLDLRFNDIKEVSPEMFINLKNLNKLMLDMNRIEAIPDQLFSGLRSLKNLSMSGNGLKVIFPYAFQGASSLETLDLSRNQLTLQPDVQYEQYSNLEIYSPFNTLVNLQELNLKMNNISYMFTDWKNVLLFLKKLDLSWNHFTDLTIADVQFLGTSVKVDLRHNDISTIRLTGLYQPDSEVDQKTDSVMLLEDNPLQCDCLLYNFILRLHGKKTITAEPDFQVGDARCSGPGLLENVLIKDLTVDQLFCSVNCSLPCTCKIRPSSNTLEMYCEKLSSIPSLSEYGLARTSMKLLDLPPDFISIPESLYSMDLSGLGLKELPFDRVPNTLKTLDLRNNDISELPPDIFGRNLSLKLSGNRFLCDCWRTTEISTMILYRNQIEDYEEVMCTDGTFLSQVDAGRLCDVIRATAFGSALATFGVFVAIVAALLYRYSLEVRVYLYSKKWFRWLLPKEKIDDTKIYDIFISFSHKDEDFVRDQLLENLEPEFKICVHYRDWIIGDMIPTQISNSVEQSKRTVVVLSRNFLTSQWGMNEFRAAHSLAVKERQVRVIVIVLEECLDLTKEHEELRAYLATNTYIKWGDPIFWDRLRYALPHKSNGGLSNGGKLRTGGLNVQLNSEGQLINAAFKESI